MELRQGGRPRPNPRGCPRLPGPAPPASDLCQSWSTSLESGIPGDQRPEGDARGPKLGHRPYVQIQIRDHGGGITVDSFPRIFDPFYTTKATGM